MARISEIRDLVWRNLEGGFIPDDSRFTKREITLYVRAGVAQALKENMFEVLNLNEYKYFSGYGKTTKKEIKIDEATELPYIEVLDKSLSIGGMRNYSITDVNPFRRWAKTYVAVRPEEVLLIKNQPRTPNVIQYTLKDSKIWFFNGDVNEAEVSLTQTLVIPDSDNDEFDIPEEVVTRAVTLAIATAERELKVTDRAIDGTPLT